MKKIETKLYNTDPNMEVVRAEFFEKFLEKIEGHPYNVQCTLIKRIESETRKGRAPETSHMYGCTVVINANPNNAAASITGYIEDINAARLNLQEMTGIMLAGIEVLVATQ